MIIADENKSITTIIIKHYNRKPSYESFFVVLKRTGFIVLKRTHLLVD